MNALTKTTWQNSAQIEGKLSCSPKLSHKLLTWASCTLQNQQFCNHCYCFNMQIPLVNLLGWPWLEKSHCIINLLLTGMLTVILTVFKVWIKHRRSVEIRQRADIPTIPPLGTVLWTIYQPSVIEVNSSILFSFNVCYINSDLLPSIYFLTIPRPTLYMYITKLS